MPESGTPGSVGGGFRKGPVYPTSCKFQFAGIPWRANSEIYFEIVGYNVIRKLGIIWTT